jgi:hypothetical protein
MKAMNRADPGAALFAGFDNASPAFEPALTTAWLIIVSIRSLRKDTSRLNRLTQIKVPHATIGTATALVLKTHFSFEG